MTNRYPQTSKLSNQDTQLNSTEKIFANEKRFCFAAAFFVRAVVIQPVVIQPVIIQPVVIKLVVIQPVIIQPVVIQHVVIPLIQRIPYEAR